MDKLKSIIADIFNISSNKIKGDLAFQELESWDSLTHMQFIVAVEQNFNVELTADEIVEMLTISKVEEILKKKEVISQ